MTQTKKLLLLINEFNNGFYPKYQAMTLEDKEATLETLSVLYEGGEVDEFLHQSGFESIGEQKMLLSIHANKLHHSKIDKLAKVNEVAYKDSDEVQEDIYKTEEMSEMPILQLTNAPYIRFEKV